MHQLWNSIDWVQKIHSRLELWAIVFFAILVVAEALDHLYEEKHKELSRRFAVIGIVAFTIAVLMELIAYSFGQRRDTLANERDVAQRGMIAALNEKAEKEQLERVKLQTQVLYNIRNMAAKVAVSYSVAPRELPLPELITLEKKHSVGAAFQKVIFKCDVGNTPNVGFYWIESCPPFALESDYVGKSVDELDGFETLTMVFLASGGQSAESLSNFNSGLKSVKRFSVEIDVNGIPVNVHYLSGKDLERLGRFPRKDAPFTVTLNVSDDYLDVRRNYDARLGNQ